MRRFRKAFSWGCVGLVVVCLALVGLSALSNQGLPPAPSDLSRLTGLDKARLAESLRLRKELGEEIWPGFGQADIPVMIWNREYTFLIGLAELPDGWEPVSAETVGEWQVYRQATMDPQNFTLLVGDRWVASMGTKAELDSFLMEFFQEMLPPVIEDVFPYRLLLQPSEVQICGVLHEGFHVFQTETAGPRLRAAEKTHQWGDDYAEALDEMRADWNQEINALVRALRAETEAATAELVRQFLDRRAARRLAHELSAELVDYERQLEWEEGLAKYVELSCWQKAREAESQPTAGLSADPYFHGYQNFEKRWSQTLTEMRLQSGSEDTRFYNTGMAQAFLLDRLLPGWKEQVFKEGQWLEDLLAAAVP